jgi:ABC-type bacteriocin/lantibiotic exporter with double-glycine peptidase domain
MVWTQPELGMVVLLIAVPQVLVTPLVQRRINALVKMRVRELRQAGDIVVDEMRDGGGNRSAEVFQSLDKIFDVRLRVFRLKFGMKLMISGLQSLSVFVLLSVGGIMVLRGHTEIGIVVAFTSGLDRVVEPLRELITFLRSASVAKVQYDMIEETLGRKL